MSLGTKLHERVVGPAVAVDVVVMTIDKGKLKVLVIKIGSGPYKDCWAVPGGLIQLGESPEKAAGRVLDRKVNIKTAHLEQLYTFGDPKRDKRGQIVSVAYYLLINDIGNYEIKPGKWYTEVDWVEVEKLPKMAYDHKKMVEFARRRLKDKIGYSTVARWLLASKFTLTEIQKVYEIIWKKKLDKRNFRKKMLGLKIIGPVGSVKRGSFRPAQMYEFRGDEIIYFD